MKKIWKILLRTFGILVTVIALYGIFVLVSERIPVQADATPEPKVIHGYILTNGVHTDLVFPVKSQWTDWSKKFPFENTLSKRTDFKYISIGWGDKGFYLDTPTWADLKFSTAFKAAFWLGDAAVHATYYDKMQEGEDCKRLAFTERQYKDIIEFVDSSLDKNTNGDYIYVETDAQYGKNDAFYEAKGTYSIFHTCNTWTNNALKKAGQKGVLWAGTDTAIFRQYQ